MSAVVCMLIHGIAAYEAAARESIRSLLADSSFDIFAAHAAGRTPDLPRSPRVHLHPLDAPPPTGHRAQRFLLKFQSLEQCLRHFSHDWILQLDADVVLARPLRESDLRDALRGAAMGMVEQKGIRGSHMNRTTFLDHYVRHTLALLDPAAPAPRWEDFRFYNSGVVVAPRSTWEQLVSWALRTLIGIPGDHQVGEHMIADQDYFQYWANSLHPGSCRELPWYWNHCEHWDTSFPKRGVLFAHFSNFCRGPAENTPERMRALRRPWRRLWNRCTPPSSS